MRRLQRDKMSVNLTLTANQKKVEKISAEIRLIYDNKIYITKLFLELFRLLHTLFVIAGQ